MDKKKSSRLTLSFGAVLMAVCYVFALLRGQENIAELSAMLVSAGVHELGHIFVAKVRKLPLGGMRLDILGARISTSAPISYFDEWLLAAGGPLFNLCSAALVFRFASTENEWINLFVFSSLGLATLNLLPVETFDGARMLHCLLSMFTEGDIPYKTVRFLSYLFVLFMWLISVYLLMRVGNSLTLFIFSACLFSRLVYGGADPSDYYKNT